MGKETSTSENTGADACSIIDKASRGSDLTREEIIDLLKITDHDDRQRLFSAADEVRERFVGPEVFLRGIVEFSNFCERDCLYCGLRKANKQLARYRIMEDEILAAAHRIKDADIATIVLQSGEDSFYTTDLLCRLIQRIKEETALTITLSIGERSYEDYRAFKKAGADRYLLKHETASPELYAVLRPGCRHEKRRQCLAWLKELGYEVGTGSMVGLPGQEMADLAGDILFVKEMDADMVGIGPFIAHPVTPLSDYPNGSPDMTLKMLAIARLLTKSTNIPATTALVTIDQQARIRAFHAGANVIMPDFTPSAYKKFYDIYPGRSSETIDVHDFLTFLRRDLAGSGRVIGAGSGGRNQFGAKRLVNSTIGKPRIVPRASR